MFQLLELLRKNHYPGRGIVLGMTPDGNRSVAVYFIMGRSENSRNRIFVSTDDGIRTEAFDLEKLKDPSLIIYHPVRRLGRGLIVTNGDQTDTIREYLEHGLSMEQALATRSFEPDAPNWTPRISGLLSPDGSYKLSILKSADAEGSACVRYYFAYPGQAGAGHFLHTYIGGDWNPLPSFMGEPEAVYIPDKSLKDWADEIWESLDTDNKVSLYLESRNIQTGQRESLIINKHNYQ